MNKSIIKPEVVNVTKEHSYISNVPENETIRDFNLIKKLHNNARYSIPERFREKIISKMETVLDNDPNSRTVIQIAETLLALDEHNLKMVSMAIPKKVTTTTTHVGVRKMSDEDLIATLQEVQKLLPRTLTTDDRV